MRLSIFLASTWFFLIVCFTPTEVGLSVTVNGVEQGTENISSVTGRVTDPDGKAVHGVMVHIETDSLGSDSIVVFTGSDGTYSTPNLGEGIAADNVTVRAQKVGYEELETSHLSAENNALKVDITVEAIDNVAHQVPGSAWVSLMPDTDARRRLVFKCSDCHETPGDRVKAFAGDLEGLTEQERETAWRGSIEFMRAALFAMATPSFAPDDEEVHRLRWDIDPADESFQIYIQPENSRHNQQDEDIIAPFLAKHMPTNFGSFSIEDYKELYGEGDALGANKDTYFKVYNLPRVSLVREVSTIKGSPYVWGVDTLKNRLLRLDPVSGEQKWFPTPSLPAGPHSIWPSDDGKLWVTLEEAGTVVTFDPNSEEWIDKYQLGAGGSGIVHDIAQDDVHDVAFDHEGRIWATFTGLNKLGSLDPKTMDVKLYDMPLSEESPMQTLVYGAIMTSDNNVWFSQIGGVVGEFNTRTNKVETIIPFADGAGPRRLAVDENDIIYVPLFGEGQLLVYDTRADEELGRYDIPDKASAPYSATWDPTRKAVWLSTNTADKVYRFDAVTKEITEYPLPIGPGLLRMVLLDYETGDLWLPYSTFPVGDGPSVLVMLHPGD